MRSRSNGEALVRSAQMWVVADYMSKKRGDIAQQYRFSCSVVLVQSAYLKARNRAAPGLESSGPPPGHLLHSVGNEVDLAGLLGSQEIHYGIDVGACFSAC
jgi:hypothetical protein